MWDSQRFRALAFLLVFIIFGAFVVWYPHLSLIPVPLTIKDGIYFYFDFWKQA